MNRAGGAGPGTGGVYLVTSADQPDLGADDRLLYRALRDAGMPFASAVWTDPGVDWAGADVCLIRSAWDYHLHADRFRRWLDHVSPLTTVLNEPRLLAWNMHKRYLRQLSAAGIPTVDTVWITPGSTARIAEVLDRTGWDQALLKPAISASAWKTAKVTRSDEAGQALLADILHTCDAMLQPYLHSVEREGEVSVIVIDGKISHAARRASALTGDIEHTRHGSPHEIAPDERLLAERVVDLLPVRPLYARVDLLRDDSGRLLLGELELIEPVLYLRHDAGAADRLAAALRRHIRTLEHPSVPAPVVTGPAVGATP